MRISKDKNSIEVEIGYCSTDSATLELPERTATHQQLMGQSCIT